MTTPLVWETYRMCNFVYGKLLGYSAPLLFDPDTWSYRTNNQKCYTFYIALFIVSTVILAMFYVVIDKSIQKAPLLLIINLSGLFFGLCILLALLPMLRNSDIWWVQYLNSIMALEIKISKPRNYLSENGFNKIWTTEIQKLLKRDFSNLDLIGILLSGWTTSMIFTGIVLAPLAMIFKVDPIYLIFEAYFPTVFKCTWTNVLLTLIRYVWQQWCTLESSRMGIIVCVPIVALSNSYLKIVFILKQKSLDDELMFLFNCMHYANQIGQEMGAYIMGTLMAFGFFLLVICNSVLVCCWKTLPTAIYFLVLVFDMNVSIVVSQTLPQVVNVWNISLGMIQSWKFKLHAIREQKLYWIRKVKAQRPVTVYYGMRKFEHNTKRNYYAKIFESTVNMSLFFRNF